MKNLIFISIVIFFTSTSCAKDQMYNNQQQVAPAPVPERTYEAVVAFPSQLPTQATASSVYIDLDQNGYADTHKNPGVSYAETISSYTAVDFRVFTGQYDQNGNPTTQIISVIVPKDIINRLWAHSDEVVGVKYSPLPYGGKRIYQNGRLDPTGAIYWVLSSQ
jgi:hypothetical protein